MAAVTLLGSVTFDTNNGTKTVTATPAVGDLIVLVVAHTGNTANVAPTDNNGNVGYDRINSGVKNSSADTLQFWVRRGLIALAQSTIFSHAPGTTTGGGMAVLKVTGMTRVGLGALRQTAKQDNQSAATPAPAFGTAALTGNPCVGAVFNATNPAGMTARASWTERSDGGYATPTTGLETMSRDSGETGTTQTWGSSSASAFASMVAELDTSADASTPFMPDAWPWWTADDDGHDDDHLAITLVDTDRIVGPNAPPQPPEDAWPWADDDAPPPLVMPGTYQQSDPVSATPPADEEQADDDTDADDWWHAPHVDGVGADAAPPPVDQRPADAWPWGDEDSDGDDWYALDAAAPADVAAAVALPLSDAWPWGDDDAGDDALTVDDAQLAADMAAAAAIAQADELHDDLADDDWWHASDQLVDEPALSVGAEWHDDDAGDDWIDALDSGPVPTPPPAGSADLAPQLDIDWDADWLPPLVVPSSYQQADNAPANPDLCASHEWLDEDATDDWEPTSAPVVPDVAPPPPPLPYATDWTEEALADDEELVIDDWQNIELDPIYSDAWSDDDVGDDWWHHIASYVVPGDVQPAPTQPPAEEWREDEPDDDWWLPLDAVQRADVAAAPTQPPEDAWAWFDDTDDALLEIARDDDAPVVADVVAAPMQPPADAWPWGDAIESDDDELVIDDYANIDPDQPPEHLWLDDDVADEWDGSSAPVAAAAAPAAPLPADAWPWFDEAGDTLDADAAGWATDADAMPQAPMAPPDEWPWFDEPQDDQDERRAGDAAPVVGDNHQAQIFDWHSMELRAYVQPDLALSARIADDYMQAHLAPRMGL